MKIVYFTEGTESLASSRLRCFKPGRALAAAGHEVIFNPETLDSADVIVVQKLACHRFGIDGMAVLKQRTNCLVWDIDDLYWLTDDPSALVDVVTVDTNAKLAAYPSAVVVPDCLDINDDSGPHKLFHADKLQTVVWFGGGDNVHHARNALQAAAEMKLDAIVITNLPGSSLDIGYYQNVQGLQWDVNSIDREITKADLVICPYVFDGEQSPDWIKAKSANRVYKAWGLGMPVAGTSIPSYVEAKLEYRAETIDEWINVYTALMPKDAREATARRGHELAQTQTADKVKDLWLQAFEVIRER